MRASVRRPRCCWSCYGSATAWPSAANGVGRRWSPSRTRRGTSGGFTAASPAWRAGGHDPGQHRLLLVTARVFSTRCPAGAGASHSRSASCWLRSGSMCRAGWRRRLSSIGRSGPGTSLGRGLALLCSMSWSGNRARCCWPPAHSWHRTAASMGPPSPSPTGPPTCTCLARRRSGPCSRRWSSSRRSGRSSIPCASVLAPLLGLAGLAVPVGAHGALRTGVLIVPARVREDLALDAGEVIKAAEGAVRPIDPMGSTRDAAAFRLGHIGCVTER